MTFGGVQLQSDSGTAKTDNNIKIGCDTYYGESHTEDIPTKFVAFMSCFFGGL